MTVNTSRTTEFDIGQIVLMGYRMAGLLNENQALNSAQTNAGKALLETIVKHLQVYGITARAVTFEVVTVTAGTREYSLSADVFDVLGTATWIDAGQNPQAANGETTVTMMDRETRQRIASKASTGSVSLFYSDRTVVPNKVWLWPIPADNGYLRFQVHRLSADSTDTTKTPDLERYWAQYLIWELAYQLATSNSLSAEHRLLLKNEAKEKLVACKAYARPRGAFVMGIDHPTGWNR